MSKPTLVLTIILLILLFNASAGMVFAISSVQYSTQIINFIYLNKFFCPNAGQTIVVENDNAVTPKLIKRYSRKILTEVQDYDYGGANSRHDPRRRPGIGGRNR